jgi:hypothetical protein
MAINKTSKNRKPRAERFGVDAKDLAIKRAAKTTIDLSDDHSSRTHPGLVNKLGKTNWVEQQGGLPPFIVRVAKHIMADSGCTQSRAIAAAVSQCGKGKLGAKGLAAYAQFKAKAAAARAS